MGNDRKAGDTMMVDSDGAIQVASFSLPLSAALSAQSKTMLTMMREQPFPHLPPMTGISEAEFAARVAVFRKQVDELARQGAESLLQRYPVNIKAMRIGDVPVEEFTPPDAVDASRVLINLHGGGFCSNAAHGGRVESIPVAHLGKFRVIAIDYRQAPEHKFPSATEDVAAVYAELLKSYRPQQIGIYGGSAGGIIASQAIAWFIRNGTPVPGAIGILSAGTGGFGDGDYFSAIGSGLFPPVGVIGSLAGADVGYFSQTKSDDPMFNPNLASLEIRAKFPPTILATATRGFDFSPALATHRALVQAGVDAHLHVFDGLGHVFYANAATPEALDLYDTLFSFFRKYLTS